MQAVSASPLIARQKRQRGGGGHTEYHMTVNRSGSGISYRPAYCVPATSFMTCMKNTAWLSQPDPAACQPCFRRIQRLYISRDYHTAVCLSCLLSKHQFTME